MQMVIKDGTKMVNYIEMMDLQQFMQIAIKNGGKMVKYIEMMDLH